MIRPSLAATLLLAIGSGVHAQSGDTPPTTPGNPVARAYGPTSGGVAWQRSSDDRGVRGYEIARDGTVLGVRDTLSYVANDLAPGRGYNFAIVAIDSAGQRSGRALARIETPDARPNRPSGLVANVYSATAAGLRWDRSGVFGERYEIKRDGVVVAMASNATSYTDDSLSSRRPYLFEVIAINRQGQRSSAARLFVRTTDGSSAPPTPGPAAPGGLRAVVYSATAGAIAWDRPAAAGVRHEVSRDGAVVAMAIDATSYVDKSLSGGRAYAYAVVAIDRTGRRSAPSRVTLTTPGTTTPPPDNPFATPDPAGTTALARLGYPAARDLAAELVSAAYLDLYFAVDATVETLFAGEDDAERVVSCPDGGTARGTPTSIRQIALEFEGCVIADRTLSGNLERTTNRFPIATGAARELTVDFESLRVDAGEAGTLTVTGSVMRGGGRGRDERCNGYDGASETIDIASARVEQGGDVTSITDATYTQGYGRQDFGESGNEVTPCTIRRYLTFEGATSVVASRLGAEAATITAIGDIHRSSDTASSRAIAMLEADFGDGSTLAVTATSDPNGDEVQVDIMSDGAAVSFTDEYAFEARRYASPLFDQPWFDPSPGPEPGRER